MKLFLTDPSRRIGSSWRILVHPRRILQIRAQDAPGASYKRASELIPLFSTERHCKILTSGLEREADESLFDCFRCHDL